VFATARRLDSLAELEAEGIDGLELDVNDDDAIVRALDAVARQTGHLDVLVNNAGFSQVGAVVDLTREDLRRQYETNVIAPMIVTGRAVPLLRAAVAASGSAVVANVGSIVGLFTTPFAAAYCSSKAALHSLTDALRMELAPFGIQVVSIQPGGVRSSFGQTTPVRGSSSLDFWPVASNGSAQSMCSSRLPVSEATKTARARSPRADVCSAKSASTMRRGLRSKKPFCALRRSSQSGSPVREPCCSSKVEQTMNADCS
jgi:NAD(P)-dependent dehydrogenase (short-subunit alcohol dehydrogenase family)